MEFYLGQPLYKVFEGTYCKFDFNHGFNILLMYILSSETFFKEGVILKQCSLYLNNKKAKIQTKTEVN